MADLYQHYESTTIDLLLSLKTTQYLSVVAVTILIWDMLISLDIEVERVWRAKKTFGTSLFFLNRYGTLVTVLYSFLYELMASPSDHFCRSFLVSFGVLSQVSVLTIEWVCILRTTALYKSKILFITLILLCAITTAHIIVCFVLIIVKTDFTQDKPIGYPHCYAQCTTSICTTAISMIWIPFFAFETIILALTVKKFFEDIISCFERTENGLWKLRIRFGVGRSTVLAMVMRDELLYYFVFMAVCVGNLILDILEPENFFYGLAIGRALQSAVCSRMLLNLRGMLESQKIQTQFIPTTCHGTLLQLSSASLPQSGFLDGEDIAECRREERY